MMWQPLPVNLATSLTVCQTTERLLQDSLGPNALHTMLTSQSGNVVITGDGFTLLTSLHLSHPLARWIVGRVEGHHGLTGDGSISFILIVTEMLRQLQDAVSSSGTKAVKQDLIRIGQALEKIWSVVFPQVILPTLLKNCVRFDLVNEQRENVLTVCQKIVRTALGGKFSRRSSEHVTALTVGLVGGSCDDIGSLGDVVQVLISDYDVTCLEAPNQPISKSKLLDGVVLTRDFVFQSEDLDSLTTVPFVILCCSLDKWIPDVHSTLAVGHKEDLKKVFQYGTSQTRLVVDHLKRHHVKLILSSELLSDATLSFCRAAGISAIHMIPEEELNRLSRLSETDIAYDSCDVVMPTLKIGSAAYCRSIILGQRTGVHLGLMSTSTKQLILCAPTQDICRQWFMAVFNALKALRMCLDTDWLTGIAELEEGSCTNSSEISARRVNTDCGSEENIEHLTSKHCSFGTEENGSAAGFKISKDRQSFSRQTLLTSHKNEALCVPGGGSTELFMHKVLQKLATSNAGGCSRNSRDPSLITAIRILSETALCIPRHLHRNSFSSKCQKSSFVEMVSEARDSAVLVGVNGKTGALCDQGECGVLEPLAGRLMLWNDAIKTVQDLLRIDFIIGVKTSPPHHLTSSFTETKRDDSSSDDDN